MSDLYSFTAPRLTGDQSDFTFLFTADAGIGAVPDNQKGGAIHNDPPVNGADQVYIFGLLCLLELSPLCVWWCGGGRGD